MKILLSLLLGANLIMTPILAEESTENPTEEQIPTENETPENNEENGVVEEEDELADLIAQWINGEIELDKETLDMVMEKLEPEVNQMLENYIADADERQMVTSVIMGIITGLGMILIMFMYTKKIIVANNTANNNNAKFSLTSKEIKESSNIIKNEVITLKDDLLKLEELVSSDMKNSERTQAIVEETLKILESKLNGIAGILKIVANGEENNEEKTQKK